MAKVFSTLSRRSFLKLLSQMFSLIAYPRTIWTPSTKVQAIELCTIAQESAIVQSSIQTRPYGVGLYGKGPYPEYNVTLPLVIKE